MAGKQYGVPYMGSKSRFAERIVSQFPIADTFVDLFAGGCAIAHCAMIQKDADGNSKYSNFILNDTDLSGIQLFTNAIEGKYLNEKRWISREDFFLLKDTDPFVHWCWSFGNCGRTYIYGKNLEAFKKSCHTMIYADTVYERYMAWHDVVRRIDKEIGLKKLVAGTEQLQDVERIQRLNKLTELKPLLDSLKEEQRFQCSNEDYSCVNIPTGSLVYCDIPYKTTERKYYGVKFDHNRFQDWCVNFAKSRPDCQLIISEYSMPEDRFECLYEIKDRCVFSPINNNKQVTERLFCVK